MIKLLQALILIVFISCSTTKIDPSKLTEEDVEISMNKGVCFDKCPVYTFKMYPTGYCEFYGELNTPKLGKHALQLSKDKYKEVKKAFENSNFFEFQDYYESKIQDLASVSLTYRKKEQVKTVTGKRERPTELHRLQKILEEIAESKNGWSIIDGTIVEKPVIEYDKSQIEIQFTGGNQITRWFNNARKAYGVRILKRLDDKTDKWLISYDAKKITPEEMIAILNADESIKSASFLTTNGQNE
ncbi:MAG: hypothetical protein HKO66_05380 [Saprospiraceae bacterium]|nr:hypothetical protein [Saprospiraceae bacterium]